MSRKDRSAISAAAGHYHAGRLTEAESLYRRVLDQHPDDVDAIQGLAALMWCSLKLYAPTAAGCVLANNTP